MNQKHLLRFIKKKAKIHGDEIVIRKANKFQSLNGVSPFAVLFSDIELKCLLIFPKVIIRITCISSGVFFQDTYMEGSIHGWEEASMVGRKHPWLGGSIHGWEEAY